MADADRAVRETLQEIFATAIAREGRAFDPEQSPLRGRAIFIIGSPRSGTTWLHQMLAAHPDVATGGESHVFCEGFAAIVANHDDPDPHMKLSTWVTRSELIGLIRQFVDGVLLAGAGAQRPDATRVLDKTPNHALHAALLGEVYPDATFIHLLRHARDSVSSASNLWSEWDPAAGDLSAAAGHWRDAVLDARQHLAGLRYVEARYEDLLADPETGLRALLEAADLTSSPELVRDIVDFGKAPINVRPSDPRVEADKWAAIDPDDEREIVVVAGDLLVELGYLTEASRTEIVARRPRAASTPGVGSRVAGVVRRRRVVEAAPGEVRRVGRGLAEAAMRGDGLSTRLARDAVAEDRGRSLTGAGPVADLLIELLAGARIVGVDGDALAAGVSVVLADDRRQLHRYFVANGRVAKVIIQGE